MSVISNNQIAGASGQGASAPPADFSINKSLRFNPEDSTGLSKTFSSAGNQKIWTWSGWVKRTGLTVGSLFSCYTGTNSDAGYFDVVFGGSNQLSIGGWTTAYLRTTKVFRDISSWYHIVIAVDTTQSTSTDRLKLYINGVQQTDTDAYSVTQDRTFPINSAHLHNVGSNAYYTNTTYRHNGYLAEVHFVDGQQRAASDFGQFDSNNVWEPKQYSGTYGTNGFHLDFDNASNLGNDAAGSNNFTANNFHGTAPGISTANQGVDVLSFTGNGGTNNVTGLNFQPDLVWIKNRESNFSHMLFDSVRGVQKVIYSNSTSAEQAAAISLTAFNSNGFSVGSASEVNENTKDIAAFCWKAGGAASSNSNGSITSSVSANNTYGFSVVKYTGATGVQTVGHGLAATPKFIIAKNIDSSSDWIVYHESLDGSNPEDKFLRLNTTDAPTTSADYWGTGGVTNSVFGLDTSILINSNGNDVIAYCWTEKGGYSKFNSFSGNGAAGNKIVTGFRPKLVIIKRTSNISGSHMGWVMTDSTRGGTKRVSANHNAQENDGPINSNTSPNDDIIFNADGFTLNSGASATNGNGETYVYAAFADTPGYSEIDSLIDTPTNYDAASGNNGGNYATLNPLQNATGETFSDGNLKVVTNTSNYGTHTSTMATPLTGKWYAEVEIGSASSYTTVGLVATDSAFTTTSWPATLNGVCYYGNNGNKYIDSSASSYGATFGNGDVIGIAYNADNGTVIFYKNGVSQGTISSVPVREYFFGVSDFDFGSVTYYWNFGQRPFANTPPTGHVSLCTTNLPTPTIADGSTAMDCVLYTGNGSTQSITGYSFSPDLVWAKRRSGSAADHQLYDAVRGVNKGLSTNLTDAEWTYSGGLSSFDSNGFSAGGLGGLNGSGDAQVAWAWDAGDSTVSNSNGSITSTVRANASAGFSIVKYTGTGSSGTVGHGLNAAPHMYIVKNLSNTYEWGVYHISIGASAAQVLNAANNNSVSGTWWNSTAPTSSVFSIGTYGAVNQNTDDFIAYCFAPVEGYSSFGVYTGNGNADGPFVYTGFRSRWILFKNANSASNWLMYDTARNTFNSTDLSFQADSSVNETSVTNDDIDILSNGFKIRVNRSDLNDNTDQIVYAAFAEHPFSSNGGLAR